jgi:organic radical activating enzyme
VETSGVHRQALPCAVEVVVSPKTPSINYAGHVAAWKYVIKAGEVNEADGLPLFGTQGRFMNVPLARPSRPHSPIYVQPCDEKDAEKNAANLAACLDSVRRFGYRLSLQQHKIINWP